MKICRIEMLGGLRVQVGEQTFTRFRSHKAGTLLSYLALNLNQNHPRELLMELFWAEMPPKAARDNLSTLLSLLRRQMEGTEIPVGSLLMADYHNIRLNSDFVTTDVNEFEQLLTEAARAQASGVCAALLERAVELYQGELLPGCYDEWAVQAQVRLKTRYGDALQRWTAALAQSGNLEAALDVAQQARHTDPYREETYQALIWLNAVLGRPALALETYRELEQFFRSELHLTPSIATRTLIERLRRDPERFAALRNSPWCEEPGASWLQSEKSDEQRDAEAVQRKAKVAVRLPQPQRAPSECQTVHLPPQFTSFFGRVEERSRLQEMLTFKREAETETHCVVHPLLRLITITGPGGVGKTRFSIEVGGKLAETYAGCVWFVPLGEVPDASLLPCAFAKALSLPSTHDSEPLEQVVKRLNGMDCLLILDNFEHLLRDNHSVLKGDSPPANGSTAYVRLLLERIPGLRCLVTSRQPLHLSGEQEFPIGPLPIPAEHQSPAQLMTCSSVALYSDRARAVKPDFAVTAQNAEAVAALCRNLEGMPLAIEMTAAWTRTLPPARLLERWEHQLDLLVSRRSDLPPRHQSLRATIEWSYGLLPPELQAAFTSLSVFRNGWPLEAAEAILAPCASSSVRWEHPGTPVAALDTLAQLQERSLILAEEEGDEIRYRLLTPLREFATEKLTTSGTNPRIHARYADYFLTFVEKVNPMFDGPQRPAAYRLLTREHDNILAALAWYEEHEPDFEKAFRIASAMRFFWTARGYWNERRRWLEGLTSRTSSRTEARARALLGAGGLAHGEEDYGRAQARFEEALDILREVECRQGIGLALLWLGMIASEREDFATAQVLYAESLTIFSALNDKRNLSELCYYRGELSYKQGDLVTARQQWEQCYALEQELGIIGGGALWVLGRLLTEIGDYTAARRVWRQHLLDRCETRGISGIMTSLEEHALLSAAQNQGERAGRLWGAAAAIRRALGSNVSDSQAEIKEYEDRSTRLRTLIGTETFEAAFSVGCSLTCEQAIAYVLEDIIE